MAVITLQNVANQQFSILLEEINYSITLKTVASLTYATIAADDTELVSNVKVLPNVAIVTYEYLVENTGNFIFETTGDDYPNYETFGITSQLRYIGIDGVTV